MSLEGSEPLPLRLPRGRKGAVRTQFAALCFRMVRDAPEICLVTSRGTGRWILPKGWPMDGQTPAAAAAMEAWEEAGLTGRALEPCLGVYSYVKPSDRSRAPILAMVFPVLVHTVHADWPERRDRRRRWFGRTEAAERLAEPDLRQIVHGFDPIRLFG